MSAIKGTGELRSAISTVGMTTITIALFGDFREQYESLKDAHVDLEIKKHRKKRSLDANALCWELCTQIGNAITPPMTKEAVYRQAIRDVGKYEPLPIRNDAVEAFCKVWSERGTGWIAEVIDDSKIPGYKLVFAYYGSSTYDTKAMSTLIDYLVDQAEQMELQIAHDLREIERIKEDWARECLL